jgi:ankyrin repeat protein/beta-lactamase regulating signal transducer with metallopeptidase domain
MTFIRFLSEPFWQQLGLTLIHFLWQGLAVALGVTTAVRLFRLGHGHGRHAAYLLAFTLMAMCPLLTFLVIGRPAETGPMPPEPVVAGADASPTMGIVEAPPVEDVVIAPASGVEMARAEATPEPKANRLQEWLPWAVGFWMLGVTVLSLRLLLGYIGIQRWRRCVEPLPQELTQRIDRLAQKLGLPKSSRIFVCPAISEAAAVGYLRPMVLLPVAVLTRMDPAMIEAVVAHELAHIRRLDLWVNLAQRIVETLLFYHPAVWWLSNRLRVEREFCCDEMAVEATGERLTYASALETVQRGRLAAAQPALALALGQSRRPTLSRVHHILGLPPAPSDSPFWLAGVVAVVILALMAMPAVSLLTAPADAKTSEANEPLTPTLMEAAEAGDINAIRELRVQGADVNGTYGDDRQTPLLCAAGRGRTEVVRLLLDEGANVNGSDAWGYTALYYAIWADTEETVRTLLSRGARVDLYPRGANRYCLTSAVWAGNPTIVRMLIEAGADVRGRDRSKWTALRYAIDAVDSEVAKLFIGTGVEIPALHKAVLAGDLGKIRQLIASGADVDTSDEFGWTPTYWALSMKRQEIFDFLLDKGAEINTKIGAGRTLLHQASRAGLDDIVQRLIAKGIDVNVRTNDGETPLMNAARAGHESTARILIASGAEVNAANKYGRSALRDAVQAGRIEMVKLLLASGAALNLENNTWGPLHIAANRGRSEIVDLLIDTGAHVNVTGTAGTPLHFAARADRTVDGEIVGQIVKKLLDHGAEVNTTEKESDRTALHFAAQRGRTQVARLLLAAGADVNAKDNQGRTPLSCAEVGMSAARWPNCSARAGRKMSNPPPK